MIKGLENWANENSPEEIKLLLLHIKSLQSCLTLCDPMVYRLPGSSVHGILQSRILECVSMPSSRVSSQSSVQIEPKSMEKKSCEGL